MQRLKAEVEQEGNVVTVKLDGELDANTAVSADDVLQNVVTAGCKAIIVDCSKLKYISSAGLGVILATLHACNHHKIKLCFCELQPKIKNVFSILGLEKVISIADTRTDALNIVNSTA